MRLKTAILAIILVISLASCEARADQRYEAQFLQLFDTITQIIAYTGDRTEFEGQVDLIYKELEEYHKLYDIYNDYEGVANIKTINDNAGIAPVAVDPRIIGLLEFSRHVHETTGGNVNVAFGAVLRIWHEYRNAGIDDPENAKLPPMELLMEASLHTDIDRMIIDEEASTVFLADPEMSLDVGAVAKGYAVEQVALSAAKNGFSSGLISVGGNVRAVGIKPSGEYWNIGIQNPDTSSLNQNLHVVNLDGMSLVTSGNYRRYYTVNGVEYHHIIDPATLYPSVHFDSVTVLNADSGLADALSTALYIMPYEEGLALIESIPGTQALWIGHDGAIQYSPSFSDYIKK
ncbi:MAG: FAD:protein FMN transferase [Clostridia bacterium]|nr:FAD:protein FMN transferase [Clostridia bacterium]